MGSERSTEDECDEAARPLFSLVSSRLKLRWPVSADAGAIALLANDWEIASNLARLPHPYDIGDALTFVRYAADLEHPAVALVITRRGDGEILGACGLEYQEGSDAFTLGYWLGRQHWGHGYATEAAQAILDYAFADAGLDLVVVRCRVTNPASRRVIHHCGFQPTGTDMVHCRALGSSIPVECYELERSTWKALRRWRAEVRDAAC